MNPGLRELEYEREQRAQREAEAEKLQRLTPLEFLCSVWQDPDLPLHARLRAASEACKYLSPQLRAVAHVTNKDSFAAMVDKAHLRAARYTIVKLEVVPALPAAQHDPAELKPSASSAAHGGQSSSGFKRRI